MRRLALSLLLAATAARAATPVEVALAKLDALEAPAQDDAALAESQALARTALGVAGEAAIDPIARRLRAGGLRCSVAAWALGEIAPDDRDAPPVVAQRLNEAMRDGDWNCRIAAASAAGRLSISACADAVLATWSDPFRPQGTDGVMLLAIAGCAGEKGDAVLRTAIEAGGDEAWSRLVLAIAARRGPGIAPLLTDAACGSPDPAVRATASLALLIQAEPAAGCALAECTGSEPDPGIRRLKYQALGAGRSPSGRALLLLAAQLDPDSELRVAAASLALLPLQGEPRAPLTITSREVRETLADVADHRVAPGQMDDVEAGATSVDLPWLLRAMRLLPLRGDERWHDDHARLAQLRARLLCQGDFDCEPVAGRVGRPKS